MFSLAYPCVAVQPRLAGRQLTKTPGPRNGKVQGWRRFQEEVNSSRHSIRIGLLGGLCYFYLLRGEMGFGVVHTYTSSRITFIMYFSDGSPFAY